MVDETIPIPTTRVNPSKTGFVTSCRSGLRCRSRWSLADVGAPRIFESDVAANERRPRVFGRDLATEGCERASVFSPSVGRLALVPAPATNGSGSSFPRGSANPQSGGPDRALRRIPSAATSRLSLCQN
jgi:hypothetical protein